MRSASRPPPTRRGASGERRGAVRHPPYIVLQTSQLQHIIVAIRFELPESAGGGAAGPLGCGCTLSLFKG